MSVATPASTFHLPPGDWRRVLDCLCDCFPAIDRATWLDRMQRGRVLDGQGAPLAPEAAYRTGMRVRYFREVADEPAIPFEATLVHADAHLVVADKPHFLPVTPAGGYVRQTLLARLVETLGNPHLVPLHRIDRATAGLVMFSADPASRAAYQALFRERRITKQYEALAPALPGIAFPHVRCSRIEAGEPFFRMREAAGPPNSETRIAVLGQMGDHWHYALEPVTGRKHQLRVHMAALGAPIRNDRFYPDLQPEAPDDFTRPLQLLARALSFVDPLTGTARSFRSTRRLDGAEA